MELNFDRVGDVERITASGTPEEMADLVLELQSRRSVNVFVEKGTEEDRKRLADAIRAALADQFRGRNSQLQPSPTERTPSQDEELRPGETAQQSDTPPHP